MKLSINLRVFCCETICLFTTQNVLFHHLTNFSFLHGYLFLYFEEMNWRTKKQKVTKMMKEKIMTVFALFFPASVCFNMYNFVSKIFVKHNHENKLDNTNAMHMRLSVKKNNNYRPDT